MKLELEFGESLCFTPVFKINGIDACPQDFGHQFDEDGGSAEDYGCGNMVFESRPATPEVLEHFGITEAEYLIVAGQLEVGLSFGRCGWCV